MKVEIFTENKKNIVIPCFPPIVVVVVVVGENGGNPWKDKKEEEALSKEG